MSLLPKKFWPLFDDPKILPVDDDVFVAGTVELLLADKLKLANDNEAGSAGLLPNVFPDIG